MKRSEEESIGFMRIQEECKIKGFKTSQRELSQEESRMIQEELR